MRTSFLHALLVYIFVFCSVQANLIHQPAHIQNLNTLAKASVDRPELFLRYLPTRQPLRSVFATKVLCNVEKPIGNAAPKALYSIIESCLKIGVRFDQSEYGLPLHKVAASGDKHIFTMLLNAMTAPSAKAEYLNVVDKEGMTAAHVAAKAGNVYALTKLFKAGALMHKPDHAGRTVVEYAKVALTQHDFTITERQKLLTLIQQIQRHGVGSLRQRMQLSSIGHMPQSTNTAISRRSFMYIAPIETGFYRGWRTPIIARINALTPH